MRTRPKRRAYRLGPLRFNRTGLRLTSITLDLVFWNGVLWERRRR